ncbi:MFS transporter [Nonomuraea sp. NEAU-A123]|uniref:MFS transporter n=1 Tax=Nonomuraea sp. NEAU-A123 TaxID=2839649 RepID=UPI001BE49806|nr:MFS transporter [Nonomuraea sp. NEAU-A123]MBT2229927.1 MFS transporter [Nonomuraea sp. NEAU-A123]
MSERHLVRLLLLNQFTIKLGFNLLMPYLAVHLTHGLGLAAWAVGLVMGVRNASQRGMALVGGYLADRLGCRVTVLAGCGLRAAGFALLGFADGVTALVVASAVTGFAGALFDPGVRSLLAVTADDRVRAFGWFNMAGQAGLLLGPLAGLALSGLDFRVVALAAAGVFVLLTVLQGIGLPALPPEPRQKRSGFRIVLGNRPFWCFALAMTGSYVLSFQVYLALPLVMGRTLGAEQDLGVGEMFALSALLVITLQGRVSAWATRRMTAPRSMAAGLAVMALAFTPLVVWPSPLPPVFAGMGEELAEHLATAPMLVGAALLALGTMLICPWEMDVIVALSGGRLIATHYGVYATLSGLGVTVGTLATGTIWDAALRWDLAWLPWAALVVIGGGCALTMTLLERLRLLGQPSPKGKHHALTRR